MKILLAISLFLFSFCSYAQEHTHRHEHEHHHTFKLGIGIAPVLVYNVGENEFMAGFHFHTLKPINEKLGLGIGYEFIAGENPHHSTTLFCKYFITKFLSVNAGPSIIFPNNEHNEYALAAHIEITTAFDWKAMHIGPMIGMGIGKEEKHASVGFHLGWHF